MKVLRVEIFAGLLATIASAQPPEAKKDPQEKFEPKAPPGEGHIFLSKFVGKWDVEKTFFPRADRSTSSISKGLCDQEMTHNGLFLKSEFIFYGPTGKRSGTGTIGFETATELFTSSWIDSRQTRMSFHQGKEKSDGKTITFTRPLRTGRRRRSRPSVPME